MQKFLHVCTIKIKNLNIFDKKTQKIFFGSSLSLTVLEKKLFCFLDDSYIVLLSLKYSSQTPFFSFIFVSAVK